LEGEEKVDAPCGGLSKVILGAQGKCAAQKAREKKKLLLGGKEQSEME